MATYNGGKFIKEQLTSILSQLDEEDEVIVSDDCSTDNTVSIIQSIGDSRIKLIHNSGRKGVNGNFENAIINSKGDFIFLSDQDDVWLPCKKDKCLKAIEGYDCIVHDCIVTDLRLNHTADSLLTINKGKPGFISNIMRNGFTGCCMCFRKEMKHHILPIPVTKYFLYDQWIGLRVEMKGKTNFISVPLIQFRRHSDSSSSASSISNRSFMSKLKSRLVLLHYLLFS